MKLAWMQLLVAFLLGAVVGATGAYAGAQHRMHRHWKPGEMQARMLERFSSKLKLTPEQRTKVAAILEDKRERMQALRAQMRPRFEEIRTSTASAIRPLLTVEQQEKFDVMNAKWEAKMKKRRGWEREGGDK